MNIWAIADLHLSISCPDKNMAELSKHWTDYTEKMKDHWNEQVKPEDLVLLAGDITWALKMEQAVIDLEWIDKLPGKKIMIKGNHDYWWTSLSKVRKSLPPSIEVIQNNAINLAGISIAGARLWDTPEYSFQEIIEYSFNPKANPIPPLTKEQTEKIFVKELHRLELSLSQMDPKSRVKIAMTHYPPIGLGLKPSRAHQLLAKYKVDTCVFGHLHNLHKSDKNFFGTVDNVRYIFTAADYLDFSPIKIY